VRNKLRQLVAAKRDFENTQDHQMSKAFSDSADKQPRKS
jgi:hypothetical protein